MTTNEINGYKGFDKDLKCLGKQYEIGKIYEINEKPVLCEKGFHFCEAPFDVFDYYPPGTSKYCEVKADGESANDTQGDTKIASSKLMISCEIGLKGMIEAGLKFILNKVDWKKGNSVSGVSSGAQATGVRSGAQATGVRSGAQATGYSSGAQATGVSSGAQATGYSSGAQATGDSSGAQATGDSSGAQATGVSSGAQATGDSSGAQATGDRSMACTNGSYSHSSIIGDSKNSVAMAIGPNSKAKGVIGSWIVLSKWDKKSTKMLHLKTVKVDGEKIKADVFYCLKKDKFVEA